MKRIVITFLSALVLVCGSGYLTGCRAVNPETGETEFSAAETAEFLRFASAELTDLAPLTEDPKLARLLDTCAVAIWYAAEALEKDSEGLREALDTVLAATQPFIDEYGDAEAKYLMFAVRSAVRIALYAIE